MELLMNTMAITETKSPGMAPEFIESEPTCVGQRRRCRDMSGLSVCLCGNCAELGDVASIQCQKIGCETIWVSFLLYFQVHNLSIHIVPPSVCWIWGHRAEKLDLQGVRIDEEVSAMLPALSNSEHLLRLPNAYFVFNDNKVLFIPFHEDNRIVYCVLKS